MLNVLLIQLPVPNNPATNVPLAAGYLKAYAHAQGLLDRVQIDILPRALADFAGDALLEDAIVAAAPDVLGVSLYTWNSERSLALALRVKRRLPALLVVAGGPELQGDAPWVLSHPGLDIGVIGEGEQTFAALLLALLDGAPWRDIPGVTSRDASGAIQLAQPRAPLADLAAVPSPYLLGYLEIAPDAMLMVEVSRWCPYACSFCLYGRNMGPKLGGRIFPLEQLLAEIRWGYARGARQIHFIEANLNLVPLFRPLMRELAALNADGDLRLYAELRGEHLSDETVDALVAAGLRVAEVGLQTANPAALRAAQRRTDLAKWAEGTRRLYARGVDVLLDVILGLPEDDADGVAQTLAFLERERLHSYDIFTLQLLPGVQVRRQAAAYGIIFQDLPPYYVLGSARQSYAELRRLRHELKLGAGLDPDAVDGAPPPRADALRPPDASAAPLTRVLVEPGAAPPASAIRELAQHVDLVVPWSMAELIGGWLAAAIAANPSALLDCYLLADDPPAPAALAAWRDGLPHTPGYLDRVAVYRRETPAQLWDRLSPRLFVVLPWTVGAAPEAYAGVAEIIWRYDLADGDAPPLAAWAAAGGAGVLVGGQIRWADA